MEHRLSSDRTEALSLTGERKHPRPPRSHRVDVWAAGVDRQGAAQPADKTNLTGIGQRKYKLGWKSDRNAARIFCKARCERSQRQPDSLEISPVTVALAANVVSRSIHARRAATVEVKPSAGVEDRRWADKSRMPTRG